MFKKPDSGFFEHVVTRSRASRHYLEDGSKYLKNPDSVLSFRWQPRTGRTQPSKTFQKPDAVFVFVLLKFPLISPVFLHGMMIKTGLGCHRCPARAPPESKINLIFNLKNEIFFKFILLQFLQELRPQIHTHTHTQF